MFVECGLSVIGPTYKSVTQNVAGQGDHFAVLTGEAEAVRLVKQTRTSLGKGRMKDKGNVSRLTTDQRRKRKTERDQSCLDERWDGRGEMATVLYPDGCACRRRPRTLTHTRPADQLCSVQLLMRVREATRFRMGSVDPESLARDQGSREGQRPGTGQAQGPGASRLSWNAHLPWMGQRALPYKAHSHARTYTNTPTHLHTSIHPSRSAVGG